jgi:hypothetical protein
MTDTSYNHAINLDNFRETSINDGFIVTPDTLADGQVMVRVSKVALTANSITYVIGSQMGFLPYLDIFPAPQGLGHIPCWGFGDVIYSKHPDVPEGERLYGFFPIASHIVCTPGKTHGRGFTDMETCRQEVSPFYNEYSYIRKEPGYAPEFEDNLMLFRPLFGTSYLLHSFAEDRGYLEDADQIIISSASSKTGMGLGYLLKKNETANVKSIGLTSARNKDFVLGLNCYDEVFSYDEIDRLESNGKAAFFDVAGNRDVMASVHKQLGDSLIYSGFVGQTHWEHKDKSEEDNLPGPHQVVWSGPDQMMTLRERHGQKGVVKLVQAAILDFLMTAYDWIKVVPVEGPEAIDARVKAILDGEIKADEGISLVP